MAIVLYIPLITVKLIIKAVIKIMQAVIFVVNEVVQAIERIIEGLIEGLSVKDWVRLRKVWELVRVCGALSPTPLSQTLFLSLKSHSL